MFKKFEKLSSVGIYALLALIVSFSQLFAATEISIGMQQSLHL